MKLYVDTVSPVVFPNHRCSCIVTFGSGLSIDLETVKPVAPSVPVPRQELSSFASTQPTAQAQQGYGQVVVHGSSPLGLDLHGTSSLDDENRLVATGRLQAVLRTGGIDPLTVEITADLEHRDEEVGPNKLAVWDILPNK